MPNGLKFNLKQYVIVERPSNRSSMFSVKVVEALGGDNEMRVPNTKENMAKCICYNCPTFIDSSLKGGFFCSVGKSERIPEMKGCICGSCPVYPMYRMTGGYFCSLGAHEL